MESVSQPDAIVGSRPSRIEFLTPKIAWTHLVALLILFVRWTYHIATAFLLPYP